MLLNITKANYIGDYCIELSFNDGTHKIVNLKATIFNDRRKIFESLQDINYFKNFTIKHNTITWANELDLAPEYLYELNT